MFQWSKANEKATSPQEKNSPNLPWHWLECLSWAISLNWSVHFADWRAMSRFVMMRVEQHGSAKSQGQRKREDMRNTSVHRPESPSTNNPQRCCMLELSTRWLKSWKAVVYSWCSQKVSEVNAFSIGEMPPQFIEVGRLESMQPPWPASRQFHLPQFGVIVSKADRSEVGRGGAEGAQAFHTSKTKLSGHVAMRAMSRVWKWAVVMPVAFATELVDCLRFRL